MSPHWANGPFLEKDNQMFHLKLQTVLPNHTCWQNDWYLTSHQIHTILTGWIWVALIIHIIYTWYTCFHLCTIWMEVYMAKQYIIIHTRVQSQNHLFLDSGKRSYAVGKAKALHTIRNLPTLPDRNSGIWRYARITHKSCFFLKVFIGIKHVKRLRHESLRNGRFTNCIIWFHIMIHNVYRIEKTCTHHWIDRKRTRQKWEGWGGSHKEKVLVSGMHLQW